MTPKQREASFGIHLITPQQLIERLPEGVAKIVRRRGIPKSGTGHYSVPNEYRRVVSEKHISTLDSK